MDAPTSPRESLGTPPPAAAERSGRVPATIRLIAAFAAFKALLFLLLGCVLTRLVTSPDLGATVGTWLASVHIDADTQLVQRLLKSLAGVSPSTLRSCGIGAFAYTLLYTVEAVGLWSARPWAEWVTVVGTTLLIPFEIKHLLHHPGPAIIILFLANVAIVCYLLRRVLSHRDPPIARM
jgi:uncharacterized membrane protein (DUF2068 family)